MNLDQFVRGISDFPTWNHVRLIKFFGWYLHEKQGKERFTTTQIRLSYEQLSVEKPANITQLLDQLGAKKPKEIMKDGRGYYLSRSTREEHDAKYGQHETTIAVSQLLKDLVGKIPDQAEQLFLTEAIKCYNVKAFRAAIVMAWNLAYDHLLNWVIADTQRLADFNAKIIARIGQKKGTGLVIVKREDFEELKCS